MKYIFSDFDGTISKYDVLNAFITTFSKGDWSIPEEKWCRGEISTEDCLKIQFSMITDLKKSVFYDFLNSIEIDPYFVEFYDYVKKNGKKLIVLSDGFDIFIKTVLNKYKIDIPVYSNKLILGEYNGYLTFDMEYPNTNKTCKINSGCCKCSCALKFSNDFIYIGDGLSDRCIAKCAKLLYAKSALLEYCKKENIAYRPFITYNEILENMKAEFKELI